MSRHIRWDKRRAAKDGGSSRSCTYGALERMALRSGRPFDSGGCGGPDGEHSERARAAASCERSLTLLVQVYSDVDPRGAPTRAYDAAVRYALALRGACALYGALTDTLGCPTLALAPSAWVAYGYKQFAADWAKGGVHLLLNHSIIPEVLPSWAESAPRPTRIWLNVTAAATPLKGSVDDLPQYTQQQWFNVRRPQAKRAIRARGPRHVTRLLPCGAHSPHVLRVRCQFGQRGTVTATQSARATSSSPPFLAKCWVTFRSRRVQWRVNRLDQAF